MDYKIYALLARASYCKDSGGIILNFKEKAEYVGWVKPNE